MNDIRPFTIAVPDEVLSDLADRLRRTRWPEAELVDDWSQGVPLAYVQEVCAYWADTYDWRAREARLNRFDHFITEIDGLDIHFIHQRSSNPDATPLVLTHGWPGSIVEFDKVIEPLTEAGFHVVAPSLPGFGFSGKPTSTGWGVEKIAEVWGELMARLGYDHYLAQGGDWGSAVTANIGRSQTEHCDGVHMTLNMGGRPPAGETELGPDELYALERAKYYSDWDSGYSTQQATRPQTVGYALADSPSGQAAWILEKFWAWTDCDGHPENVLSRDELLDNIMLYWATSSATSSARIYWESFGRAKDRRNITIPSGFTVYPKEIVPPVRRWCEGMFTNIVSWNERTKGGHFAAFEQPESFVDDVVQFAAAVRAAT
ncbi:MAG: epoxide hydrolase [Acidimicrobiales bacterium]